MKIIVSISFFLIFACLAAAYLFFMKDKGKTNRMVIALGLRVGISIVLFALLLASWWMGWIHPTGIR